MAQATARSTAQHAPRDSTLVDGSTAQSGSPFGGRPRIVFERMLRGLAIALIVWSIIVFATGGGSRSGTVRQRDLPSALVTWTTGPAPHDVSVQLDTVPDAATRAWMAAIAASGTHIGWTARAQPLPGTALAVRPLPDPAGRVRLMAAAPNGSRLTFGDDLGPLDSVTSRGGSAAIEAPPPAGMATAAVSGAVAHAAIGDSLLFRPVIVVGSVGWESKFLVRALEERGWRVDLRLAITPRAQVRQGSSIPIDTGRAAAVVVVGEPAGVDASAVQRYVADGGGLILADGAERFFPGLAAGDTSGSDSRADASTVEPRAAPPALVTSRAIERLRDSTVGIERRGPHVVVAMRSVGVGRVEQIGYRDLWRWRMMGGDSGLVAYRRWWAARLADVAYAPAIRVPQPVNADPAPLVAWINRIGAPAATAHEWLSPFRHPSLPWLFAIVLAALAAEWWSRRLRGAT